MAGMEAVEVVYSRRCSKKCQIRIYSQRLPFGSASASSAETLGHLAWVAIVWEHSLHAASSRLLVLADLGCFPAFTVSSVGKVDSSTSTIGGSGSFCAEVEGLGVGWVGWAGMRVGIKGWRRINEKGWWVEYLKNRPWSAQHYQAIHRYSNLWWSLGSQC